MLNLFRKGWQQLPRWVAWGLLLIVLIAGGIFWEMIGGYWTRVIIRHGGDAWVSVDKLLLPLGNTRYAIPQ